MKKLLSILLCTTFILSAIPTFAEENDTVLGIEREYYEDLLNISMSQSMETLSNLDIVHAPLNEAENTLAPISRGDAFELVCIVMNGGRYTTHADKRSLEITGFVDLPENQDDLDFLLTLLVYKLITGRISESGEKYVALDEKMTYYEALALISRMFMQHYMYAIYMKETASNTDSEYPYYIMATELGLINSTNLNDFSVLHIDKSELNNNISTLEFVHLLCSAMYIPTLEYCEDGSAYPFRYIDNYLVTK